MSAYYYLISSLPMLFFGEKAPLTLEAFTDACTGQLRERDMQLLGRVDLLPLPQAGFPTGGAAERFRQWEVCLRNRIAVHRAPQGRDVHHYLQEEKGCFCEIDTGIQEAFAMKNPLDRENYFDRMRWQVLEDIESGHHFDFDKLCVYKLKLLLLEKRNQRRQAEGVKNLELILEDIDSGFDNVSGEN
ncbi:MAG: DUF2764 family protein [Victivallales bacterium]|nr:DUF2764 family protein [Victivallales bacterium]